MTISFIKCERMLYSIEIYAFITAENEARNLGIVSSSKQILIFLHNFWTLQGKRGEQAEEQY